MRSPIIKQIIAFGIISAVIPLVLACFGFGIVEIYKINKSSIQKLQSQIDILAYNLQPTLLFEDKDAAYKILLSLKQDNSITRAILYRANGKPFASYIPSKTPENIRVSRDILYNDKYIGKLVIGSVYLSVQEKYVAYVAISLLIILISVPLSFFISAPIRKQVSMAVTQLEEQSDRLRQLADQVATTEQKERKRIAALIHDHLQQILAASKIQMELGLRRLKGQDFANAETKLAHGIKLLDEATMAARSLTVELRPPVLYEAGLGEAFKWLANKFKADYNFETVLDTEEIPVHVSDNLKILIFEAVKELLFNAVKYAGVTSAQLLLRYRSGYIFISVEDKGRGFNAQNAEKIASAHGFGLFGIRERIKLLRGSYQITSHPGGGTKIEMKIPVYESDVKVEQGQAPEKELIRKTGKSTKKKMNILLADDHKIVREGLFNLLKENEAFNIVAQAENGLDAVEKTKFFHPDVVVMDINMPKLNGIEATRIIKNSYANIHVIGLSVQDERDVAESMKKAGAVTLINKAGDPQELVDAILKLRK